MHQHLGIRPGTETVAFLFQLPAKFRIIKDLPVENHPDSLIFIGYGLPAAFKVYYAEPCMGKPGPGLTQKAISVRSPMGYRPNHTLQTSLIRLLWIKIKITGYAAHVSSFSIQERMGKIYN